MRGKQKRTKLATAIRTLRKAKGLTQADLAKACRVSQTEVSFLETGAQSEFMKAKTAVLMARKLGIDPLVLLELGRPDFAVWRQAFATKDAA